MDERLVGADPHVVVHPGGDEARLAVRPLSVALLGEDRIAGDRIAESWEEADAMCERLAGRYGLQREIDPRRHRLQLAKRVSDEVFWLAILTGRENDGVSVAQAQWFDVWDYRLACDEAFSTEEEAQAAAHDVAQRYGLAWDFGDPVPPRSSP